MRLDAVLRTARGVVFDLAELAVVVAAAAQLARHGSADPALTAWAASIVAAHASGHRRRQRSDSGSSQRPSRPRTSPTVHGAAQTRAE